MSDESIQAGAEILRADFLNASTNHQRWKVLNRAIDWAVAASESADWYRQQAQKENGGTPDTVLHGNAMACAIAAQERGEDMVR